MRTLVESEILSHADQALYRSKEAGRNKVHCYQDDEQVVAVTKIA